jgi:hypothetical protein
LRADKRGRDDWAIFCLALLKLRPFELHQLGNSIDTDPAHLHTVSLAREPQGGMGEMEGVRIGDHAPVQLCGHIKVLISVSAISAIG